MIGMVAFTSRGVAVRATLADDRSWSVEPPLSPDLDVVFRTIVRGLAKLPEGPSDGIPGRRQVSDLARMLGGTYSFPPHGQEVDPKVY